MCFVCCLCEGPKFWEGFYGQLDNGGPGTDHGGNPPERSHLRVHDGKCLQTQTYRRQRMVWSPRLLLLSHSTLQHCACQTLPPQLQNIPVISSVFFFKCKYNIWEKNIKCVCVCVVFVCVCVCGVCVCARVHAYVHECVCVCVVCVCCVCVWATGRHYCWLWNFSFFFKFQLNHPLPFKKAFCCCCLLCFLLFSFSFLFLHLHSYRWICLIFWGVCVGCQWAWV